MDSNDKVDLARNVSVPTMELFQIKQIMAHTDGIFHAQCAPATRMLATCSLDETVKIWSTDATPQHR
jgi:WD40 repeat protein